MNVQSVENCNSVKAIEWRDNSLILLDQRLLPVESKYLNITSKQGVYDAIKDMAVRGAPAIGISAAYGFVLALKERIRGGETLSLETIAEDCQFLGRARPTAINLAWALKRMEAHARHLFLQQGGEELIESLLEEAKRIHQEDVLANQKMGALGADYIAAQRHTPQSIITHCNTGSLATGGYGTALGVIRAGFERGLIEHVFVDETRPWLQGTRLTHWELQQDGIPCSVNADSAGSFLMLNHDITWLIVGADRIVSNGDVANKIGTYHASIAAHYHRVKVMVVAPVSTIDMSLGSGANIEIEYREDQELTQNISSLQAYSPANAQNPVFDITPAALIDVIVTEAGIIEQPDESKMAALFSGLRNA